MTDRKNRDAKARLGLFVFYCVIKNRKKMMELSELTAISPVDGRYRSKCEVLADYFSEFALIRYRVMVEVEYFIALCELPLPQLADVDASAFEGLRDLYRDFSEADALRVKEIEKTTNHDVKAVEYLVKEKMEQLGIGAHKEFVHFGLTSQDINNTAIPSTLRDATNDVYYPLIEQLVAKLTALSKEWEEIPLLAHTHGQPASPTKLGKEICVFVERLNKQIALSRAIPSPAKFGGATGNFNAHVAAYPGVDWIEFANRFVNDILHLERSQVTTQIEHYDNIAAILDNFKRINTILIDLCRDMWTYISMEYFKQKIKAGEVGSSAMPHKVNPIDFENAEGNLGVANAVFEHLSSKLPISRMQRPDRLDRTAEHRRADGPYGHRLQVDPQRDGQADHQPRRDQRRPRTQLGGRRRRHPDDSAPRSLSEPVRGAESADPHQQADHRSRYQSVYRRIGRAGRSQGRAPQAFAADLYRRVQILKPFLRDAMSHSIKYRIR